MTRSARTISASATRTIPRAHSSRLQPERVGELGDRRVGGVGVQRDASGQRPRRVEVAQDDMGVGDRRVDAAASVARRSGHGSGGHRPDAQRAARVAPRDRTAAGADRVDVDHRQRQRPAADLAPGDVPHRAAGHDRHVARRAAHVEAQEVGLIGVAGDQCRGGGAAGRSAEHGQCGVGGRELEVGEAAAGLHDPRLDDAGVAGAVAQRAQIVAQQRRERGVDLGRGGALVLAKRADDVVRQRDRDVVAEARAQRRADRAFVGGVAVGMEQADGDRLGLATGIVCY